MSVPKEVSRLIEKFNQHLESYRSGKYNEAQLRNEFLNPFFKALGWDMDNDQGLAEAYKDVVHEDSIRIGGAVKAPDYCFRIGGTRKFFLEAKKPSVDIGQETSAAYQLHRYAWSAKLPLSILSDFEEFAVYDCRVKPKKTDAASTARVFLCRSQDYPEKWEWISSIFSKEAILKGSFDKYAEENKAKRGTSEVDDDFLSTIESWRSELAKNLALRNSCLSQRELNFAVQRIIDRIIFLRICEDRGIEPYGRLQGLTNGANIYPRLCEVFEDADAKYNSGLFNFQAEKGRHEPPDEITLGLELDDKLFRSLLRGLYYPESPYEFTVISSDILGQAYEQFLGKVIRLTEGHHAVVEDKPEVKKAGGVYYTPAYIVDYIVKQTVGKLIEGKTPKQASRLRILDPACGSGSFLINAYQFLLDWHRDWYLAHKPETWTKGRNPVLVQTTAGWKLAIAERKRILLDNIYGVDIDPQAVEVTKLSLLLKVLEGESEQTIQPYLRLFSQRALPDLGNNIKCGNSLIGPDFYSQKELPLLSDDEKLRINVFDWAAEFSEIMKTGGFDAVIGNPPYIRQEALSGFKEYFASHYEAYDGVADIYVYFMEKGIRLLRDGGVFSIIVSSSFLRATYANALRLTLKKRAAVLRIVDFGGLPVFANAKDTYVCIPLLAKGAKQKGVEISKIGSLEVRDLTVYVQNNKCTVPHERFSPESWSLKSNEEAAVFYKVMKAGKPLGEYAKRGLFYGIKTGLNKAFIIDNEIKKRLIAKDKRSSELIKPALGGEDIRRYIHHKTNNYLIFTRRGVDIDKYPAIKDYLTQWREDLLPKKGKSMGRGRKPGRYQWYEIQDDVAYYKAFDGPKLIFPDIAKGPRFSLDKDGHYLINTAYCISTDDHYLLGFLNSRLFWFAISNISIPFGIRAGQYRYRLIYQYMEKVPIRVINFSDRADVSSHSRIVELANLMLNLHQQLPKAKTPHEIESLQRQIVAADGEIDQLVYRLYGLTDKEIRIVEEATAPAKS
jgi:predicted type IV restriction endonuclease